MIFIFLQTFLLKNFHSFIQGIHRMVVQFHIPVVKKQRSKYE